jgi:hypothetical protein
VTPLPDRWRIHIVKPVAEAEEGQTLIDRGDLFRLEFAEHAPDTALIDGSQMVDPRKGLFCETALARGELRL